MHGREIPKTLVLPMPLFDGGAQFIGGTDLRGREGRGGSDDHPIFAFSVLVHFATDHRRQGNRAVAPAPQITFDPQQGMRNSRRGCLVYRRLSLALSQGLLPFSLPLLNAEGLVWGGQWPCRCR